MKSYSRSVRMTDEVRNIVESFPVGEGFNQKFENLVLHCFTTEKKIDEQIKNKEKYLSQITNDIFEKSSLLQKLSTIEYYLDNIIKSNSIQEAAARDLHKN